MNAEVRLVVNPHRRQRQPTHGREHGISRGIERDVGIDLGL